MSFRRRKFIPDPLWLLCVLVARPIAANDAAKPSPPAAGMSIVFVGDIMLDGGPGHAISSGRDPFAACSQLLQQPCKCALDDCMAVWE